MAHKSIGVDHQGQTVETVCMMMIILGPGTADILESVADLDSHGDEHGGFRQLAL